MARSWISTPLEESQRFYVFLGLCGFLFFLQKKLYLRNIRIKLYLQKNLKPLPMKWFVKCIRNYGTFRGRACRKEYWYFILFTILFMIAARVLDLILFSDKPIGFIFSPFSSLFALFVFLPQVAVMTRRLHDTGRSGKWVLWYYIAGIIWAICLIVTEISAMDSLASGSLPVMSVATIVVFFGGGSVFLVWAITFLVWFCTKGTTGDNKYGPDPLSIEE